MQPKMTMTRLVTSLLLLMLTASLHAANSVSNTVTHATFTTVTEALAALTEDGQTLAVSPGVYTEPELLIAYAVTLQGADAATTVLQPAATPGTAASRVASVDIPAELEVTLPVVFENLTLRNGNTSGSGGALSVQEGTLLVSHCAVSNNAAAGGGGGLYRMSGAAASLTVEDTLITRNTAGSQGGGVMRGSCLRCTVTANRAADGAGAAYSDLAGCTVSSNAASGQGGGLFRSAANRCTVYHNTSLFGGGAFNTALASSLLTENAAVQRGGGLYQGAVTNCTLVANTANTAGGGLWGATAVNSILYNNQAPSGANYDGTASLTYCSATPLAAGAGNTAAYPRFRNIDTGDYSLLSHSPCVNAGNSAAAPAGTDLNGDARIQGASVDLGAFEHNPALIDNVGFEQWLNRHGLPADVAGQFGLDYDGDGIPNGLAFAFGANRIDGGLLSVRSTADGMVAETAVQQPESLGYVDIWVETTGSLADTPVWTNALPVAVGAPPGAARFRRDAPDAVTRGLFRLKAALP